MLVQSSGRFAALLLAVVASAGPITVGAQAPAPDPFARVSFLVGRWQGTAEGRPGKGTVRREYARVLNQRFIRVVNRSEYPAQEKNPKGEIHEDEGSLSFDRSRKALVLRQFHGEGFVNQYVEDVTSSSTRVVFITGAIEKPFEVYSRSRFTRTT